MITKDDLMQAISECQGERNPNANTCIKLAAFYTIKNELYPEEQETPIKISGYSFQAEKPQNLTVYEGDSEVAKLINGKPLEKVLSLFDEVVSSIQIIEPRLYAAIISKLRG